MIPKMLIKATLMDGAGNTFLLLPGDVVEPQSRPQRVRSWSASQKVDGVVFLTEQDHELVWSWDFYNRDGSKAEMCGNAARCAVCWISQRRNLVGKWIVIKTLAGEIKGKLDTDGVKVIMPEVSNSKWLELGTKKIFFAKAGVPHLVVPCPQKDLEDIDLISEAKFLRQLPALGPSGANVTFVFEVERGKFKAKTWERGVEGFTLACGTGAVAAAEYLRQTKGLIKADIHMPGGTLSVDLSEQRPLLMGPVKIREEVLLEDE
ncbi:MAG: diaminopimelate epimerase [Bdellovibrionaceae bacterium]|nr:diaminopimelate epimerase [Pseudobdellovibrionaceae bacterium]